MKDFTPPCGLYEAPDQLVIRFEMRQVIAASDWNNGDVPDDPSNWNNPYGDTVL